MLGLDIHSLKHAKETKHVAHDPKNSPFAARLLLTKKSQEALLQANKSVNIWGNGTKSRLALDSTTKMIKVDNQAGDVLIQSGTTSITLKKGGDIAISGPNVKVTGNFDVAGGALSVTGVGVPTVSDLQAAVTKLENADLDESIARTLLEMEVAFDRLATMENKV
jgi:phage baseplate assembly protein gpV